MNPQSDPELHCVIYNMITRFLIENQTKTITSLYEMVLAEIEPPMLQAVMEKERGNQLQAARILGLSRNTMRKKLKHYFGDKYFRLTDAAFDVT